MGKIDRYLEELIKIIDKGIIKVETTGFYNKTKYLFFSLVKYLNPNN